jgi:hypothetical protein
MCVYNFTKTDNVLITYKWGAFVNICCREEVIHITYLCARAPVRLCARAGGRLHARDCMLPCLSRMQHLCAIF